LVEPGAVVKRGRNCVEGFATIQVDRKRALLSAEQELRLHRTGAPLYRDVAAALERAIRIGVWARGEKIPTEVELETQFGASRGTLRAAIGELVRKGLLYRQAGRGTFVLGSSFSSLERYFRYERMALDAQIIVRNEVLDKRVTVADAQSAAALHVAPGSRIGCVRRLRLHETEPFLIIDSYFPPSIWDRIEDADFTIHPLYDTLKDKFELFVVSADEYLRPSLASAEEAGLMQIAPGSAVIRLERIAYTFDAQPIEYRRATGRGDRFRYHVRLE
jgi:GntR family transcriptional regulator